MTIELFKKFNAYDFMQVNKEDWEADQDFHSSNIGALADAVAGSGVLLDFPTEPIVFDSDELDAFQQGILALDTFDGQGIFETPYLCSDTTGGNQLSLTLSSAAVEGFLVTSAFIIGKLFDDSLVYEIVEFNSNVTKITRNHFTEVTNILFQNFRGNLNTSVDGYGCFNVGGRILITEASSMKLDRGCVAAEQILEPDLRLRYFKPSNAGNTLRTEILDAIGSGNDIDDLNINTTTATDREFAAGASTSLIFAQKFKVRGDNIQKISLALSLAAAGDWSGTLEVGVRPLLTTTTNPTDFLPDTDIAFDPDVNPLETLAFNQSDLEARGVVLTTSPQVVDFVFSSTSLGNPTLSGLIDGDYYAITLRRLGSTTTGTIKTPEARNSDSDLRLSVFESGVWTDISDSSLWFRVWTDGAFVANGISYDAGLRLAAPKTETDNNNVVEQNFLDNIVLADTAEDAENYIIIQADSEFSDVISHPRTGDPQATSHADVPLITAVEQSDVVTLFDAGQKPLILGRIRDRNAKDNPQITGTLVYPGLAINNTVDITNPSSDLLTQNVVGSVITPNLLQPTKKYRIIKQQIISDLFGDTDADGIIDIEDSARVAELDGYSVSLSGGTVAASVQLAAVLNGSISVDELIRADVDDDGYVTSADDGYEMSQYLINGTAFTAGSGYTRVRLTLEPILNPISYLNFDAESSLDIHVEDSALINNTSFTTLNYRIDFIPTWDEDTLEVTDLRRFITTTFLDFTEDDLESSTENGGLNSAFIPGDMYLTGSVKNLDGTSHTLDYEKNIIELELPNGDTIGEINIFNAFVEGQMRFSDGALVSSSAINDEQVRFAVAVSSYVRNVADGYEYNDGYVAIERVLGTYIDHDTGLLRIHAKNIVEAVLYPELRTRLLVSVELKKAGFANSVVRVTSTELGSLLE